MAHIITWSGRKYSVIWGLNMDTPKTKAGGITIDKGFEIPVYSPVCTRCANWRPDEGGAGRQCRAFTKIDSIPLAIWNGENDHRSPFPGDNGIQFQPVAPAIP